MGSSKIVLEVAKFKDSLKKAVAQYDKDVHTMDLNIRRTRMNMNQVHMAVDFLAEARRIMTNFYVECDIIIEMLDKTVRDLLSEQPTASDIRAVIELIEEIIEDIETMRIDFDVTVNSDKVGSIDNRAIASANAKKTLAFWKHHYQNMPDYSEDQQGIRDEAKQKEKAAQDQRNVIVRQQNTNKKYQKKAQELTDTYLENVALFQSELQKEIDAFAAAEKNAQKEKVAQIQKQLEETRKSLANAGFFAFGQKKQLGNQIKVLTADLAVAENPQLVEKQVAAKSQLAEKAVAAYREKILSHCQAFLSVQEKSIEIPSSKQMPPMSQCSPEEAAALQFIIRCFGSDVLPEDIMSCVFPEYPSNKVFTILRRLVDKGYLVKTERGRHAYYSTVDKPTTEVYEAIKWNRDAADKPCPEMPDIKKVLGL